jgi:hypothetical protein
MVEKVSEMSVIINDQLVDDCSMDILRWKLVLVSLLNYLSHLCEVARNSRSILPDDQIVVVDYVLKELCVIWKVFY